MRIPFLIIIISLFASLEARAQITINGTIVNNSTIAVEGDFTNSRGSDYSGDGEVILMSADPVNLNANGGTFTVLSIEGSDVIVVSDLFISGTLEMISGNLQPSNGSTIVIQNGANVSNAGPGSYVEGAIYFDLSGLSGGSVTYPVGKNGNYLPITLQSLDASGTHGFEVIDTRLNADDNFDAISPRHWARSGLGNSTFNEAVVTLPILGDEEFESDDLTVVQTSSQSENVTLVATNFQGGNTITSFDPVTQRLVSIGEIGIPLVVNNVITPNGDLQNDILYVENVDQFNNVQVQVINRWGIEVFNRSGYDNDQVVWRGTTEDGGEILAPGNYIAVIKADNKTIKQTISLVR